MIVDWFTIIAQAINFLILIWLMKRFLYKPIHLAIEEREKKISLKLADADKKKSEAQNEIDNFKKKNQDFDQQREELLKKATADAKAQREQLLEKAQTAVVALKEKAQASLRNDEKTITENLSQRIQKEVFSMTRKALIDLAGTTLEAQLVNQFILRIANLSDQEKQSLSADLLKSSNTVVVKTSFEPSEALRTKIDNELKSLFRTEAQIKFTTSADLICGIEIGTNGQKVSWSLGNFLGMIEEDVRKILVDKNASEVQTKTNSIQKSPDVRTP